MSNNLKIELSDSNPVLSEVFVNNSKDMVNPLLPFGLHIKGNILICTERCGQKFSNTDIKVNIMKNYGKILMLKPSDDKSELTIFHDSRNDDTDNEGNGKYKLKYICFSCPSLIKIGESDSDMQSYLIYSNDKGLYSVVCTLYTSSTAEVDALPNALLSSLLTSNNIPEINSTKGSLSTNNIDITHFFPQKNKEYYEYINSDNYQNKKDILVKVFRKKVNISSNIVETLKQKLFNPRTNNNYSNFTNGVSQLFDNRPKKINIFYIPNIELPYADSKEKMTNPEDDKIISEENETEEEEEISLITKLRKSSLEKKEDESFVNFTNDKKIYTIDIENGDVKKDNNGKDLIYENLEDLLLKNKDYNEDDIKRAVTQFPNYIYKNSYWRFDYKIRLYEIISDDDENFKIIDADSLDDIKNKVGYTPTRKDEFYALKNFPNYGLPDKDNNPNKYYVSYYYLKSESSNQYVTIMYIFLCWFMILANYIFYRIIFFSINKDYKDVSIDDDIIINDDKYKQLAAYRLLINILFIVQIIFTILYSISMISGISDSNSMDNAYTVVYPLLLVITIGTTLFYGYKRLYFNKEEVSYAESKSLKLLLDSGSENNNNDSSKIITWFGNAKELITYLYLNDSNHISDPEGLISKIKELKEKIDSKESSTNIDNEAELLLKAENILQKLEEIAKKGNDDPTKSKFNQFKNSTLNTLYESVNKIKGTSKTKTIKNNAANLINSMKKLANKQSGGSDFNHSVILPETNTNTNHVPIITASSSKSGSNNNNYDYKSNNFDGKEFFPNLNSLNENMNELENGEWYDNLIECVTIKNIFLFIVFYVIFMYIYRIINNIINTFDLTEGSIYKNASSNITYPSTLVYLIINILLCGLYGYEKIYKYYFVAKETINNKKDDESTTLYYSMAIIFYFTVTWFVFNYGTDDTWGKAYYYIILSSCILYIGYKMKQENDWGDWKKWAGIVVFFIFYFIAPLSNRTLTYKIILTLAVIILYVLNKYVLSKTDEASIDFNNPITLPVSMNNNNFSEKPKPNFNKPIVLPNEEALGKIEKVLNTMVANGGKIKDKKKQLTESINVLNNLKNHYESIDDIPHIELITNMITQIEDIRDLK
jgi:carbonic anhydrase